MKQLEATEAQLRAQIAELEQQKVELADPVYIAAQARQRLGFAMPGDVTYQVRLPSTAAMPSAPGGEAKAVPSDQPWYTALWHTIADEPHGVSPNTTPEAPPARPAPPPPRPVPPLPVVERSDLDAVARQLSGEPSKLSLATGAASALIYVPADLIKAGLAAFLARAGAPGLPADRGPR